MQDTSNDSPVSSPHDLVIKEEDGDEVNDEPPSPSKEMSPKEINQSDKSNSSEGELSSGNEDYSGKYKCPGCEVTVGTKHELTVHIRSHNSIGGGPGSGGGHGGTKCTICGKVLGSQASLDRHVLVHSGERPFKCRLCGLAFTTNGNMNRHLRSHVHHQDQKKRKLEFNNNLDESAKKSKSAEPYNCPQCDQDFISLHVLENHLEECHPEFSAECSECQLAFKSYRVLNLHRFMVHYKPEKEVDLSLVEFSTEKFPMIARAITHPRPAPSPQETQKDFFETLDLKKSPTVKKEHLLPPITPPDSDLKDNPTEEEQDCSATELRKMKLKGEFPCRSCTAVFPNLRALKGHNRVHLSVPCGEYRCNMCPYADADKTAVIRHMRTHNGDRPYECSLCNYAFTTKANCERHLRNRHSATKELLKTAVIYHQSEESDNSCKSDVKRSLFPENSDSGTENSEKEEEEEEEEEEGDEEEQPEECDEDVPLDLSMDALDLSKKKTQQPQLLSSKNNYDLNVPKVESFYSNHFLSGFTPPFSPYYVPPRVYYRNDRELSEMKERIQIELIRGLQLNGGTVVLERSATPEKVKKQPDPPVKMVIKNGVLVPKQKQRRYRTERPFGCEHCSARFTLRSNMERHIKQQHPQFWSQRQRGGGGGRRQRLPEAERQTPPPPTKPEERVAEPKRDTDLASVSKLLDNASTQTFKQYFTNEEEGNHSDEEGLVASHSEENNSGSDETKSEEGNNNGSGVVKKKSAYSLAPNRVSCPYCSRKFPWSSSLRRHVLTHTGQKPFKCTHCPLLFTTKSNCDRHLLRKHGGAAAAAPSNDPEARTVPDRPFKCDKCSSSTFSSQEALRKHMTSKHDPASGELLEGSNEHPFKCHLCDSSFQERQEALDHLQVSHPADYTALVAKGALESSSCDEEPDEPNSDHKKFPDYANRKVVCALCVRRFWSAEDLRRHMRTHTGERPFSCDVCNRRFTLKHSMLRHRKKHDSLWTPPSLVTPPPPPLVHINNNNNNDEGSTDLISNLLGIRDKTIIDKMIEKKSALDAALLLGVNK